MSTTTASAPGATNGHRPRLNIRYPQRGQTGVTQDEEWCEVVDGDNINVVHFHDYANVFGTPGFYDQVFGGPDSDLKCISPQVMSGLLRDHLHRLVDDDDESQGGHDGIASNGNGNGNGGPTPKTPKRLRVLDFGAGNGMIGEEIRALSRSYGDGSLAEPGATFIVGFDLEPEAKKATERDRPGVYDGYTVADITEYVKKTPAPARDEDRYDVLISISALAFGHASAESLLAGASLVRDGGLIVFNLKEGFLDLEGGVADGSEGHENGTNGRAVTSKRGTSFSQLVREAIAKGQLSVLAEKEYRHRLSVTGESLNYVGVVVQKHSSLG